jgi:MFS family permease
MDAPAPRRDLNLIVAAVGISAVGDFLAVIPLALKLQEDTGSGLLVACLFIALWAPVVVFAGVAGLVVDRVESRRLLLLVSLAQAVIAVGLAFSDSVAATLVLVTLLGTGFAFAQPAEFALIPAAAGEDRLAVANGRVETARYVGMTAGPLIGGLVSAAGGTSIALLLNAASFVVVALAALVLRARREPNQEEGGNADRARDGIVFLFRNRYLGPVVAVAFVSLLFMTGTATAEVFFAKDVLRVGDAGYGLLMTSWMLGMVIGALVLPPRIGSGRLGFAALVGIGVQGLGIAVPTVWLVFWFALLGYLIGGVAHGMKNVVIRTLIHERTPERLRGRTFAAYNGLRNGAELVALLAGGALVAAIGSRLAIAIAGGGAIVAALAGLALGAGRDSGDDDPALAEVERALAAEAAAEGSLAQP